MILNQGNTLSLSENEVSKKVIHLLRHSQQVHREEDGAVHFWRIKENLQNPFPQSIHWSDERWKSCLAAGEGAKRRVQYCTDDLGVIIYFRALQGHSGCNPECPTLQDNVIIQSGFFQYVYHFGCGFNLHSIINSGLIPGGQILSNRQTVFLLLVDPMDKNHKDLDTIDLSVPRHAQYMHKAWKRHQDAVYWVDIDLAIRKGLKFYQTRLNAIILHEALPAHRIPKVVRMETGEVIYEKVYMSPRPPPKISLKHDWKRELGSEHAQGPEGQVVQQSRSFPSNQPIPNPSRDRTGKLVVCPQRRAYRSQEMETRSFREEAVKHDRTGKPVVCRDENHERTTVVCSEQASHPRFSREGQNLIVEDEINHDRTKKPVVCPQEGAPQTRFSRDSTNFNVEDEIITIED